MITSELLDQYASGAELLRRAIAGMTASQLDAVPIAGLWSTRQVVCHIADFELVYADRLKRVIAEHEPTFFGGDPDTFAAGLAYHLRDVDNELHMIDATRRQMLSILQSLSAADFQRMGIHNQAGALSLTDLLQGIAGHLPHHVAFIDAKRRAL